jgi:hypothetical protein
MGMFIDKLPYVQYEYMYNVHTCLWYKLTRAAYNHLQFLKDFCDDFVQLK